ncbi:hypothetical protein QAD02_017856 [Eretmocerus hayati]|uniref:Uncharacterized protein n=1 Tax=Eretmocerus hayati TaxID=131215 RepID=A0ACC2PFI5_9HYME|nr:hypothetical protein QAD02_017856 [Eretmocerus hayati]
MLSVAHQPETPGSASKHSGLGHSWAQANDRSNVLKRRKTETECRVPDKKPALSPGDTYSVSNHPEITLTIIPGKNSSQNRIRDLDLGSNGTRSNLTIDQEQLTISCTVEDNERTTSVMPPVVLSLLENSGEIQLTKLGSKEQVKLPSLSVSNEKQLSPAPESTVGQLENKTGEVDTPKKENNFLENNPLAELSEVTIEPCSTSHKAKNTKSPSSSPSLATSRPRRGTPRNASRLSKAADYLKEKESSSKKPMVTTSFSEKFDNNLKISSDPDQNFDFDAKSDFSTNDYEPFNVGVLCDRFYGNSKEKPHYAHGFPNPPGENRCWSNATLQALFTLPVLDCLDSLETPQCSKLMSALVDVQTCWRKGNTETHHFDQIFNTYKDELSVLDKLYSSKAQQDVSEFIMNLLNFVKTELGKKSSKEPDNNEIENIPNNEQDPSRKSQSGALESDRRLPLADISASAGQIRSTHSSSTKAKDSSEDDTSVNPIDEYFSLYMAENYVCESCCKQRQQKVENLMLFIDLPTEDSGAPVNLVDMINTTYALEHRNMTCESCKHEVHSMETKFKKLPKILTVQVKRYEMTNEGVITKKSTMVDIPRCLRLDSLVINNSEDFNHSPEYEPVCIISHIGDNIDSGHYISFVKHQDQWFYYDDMNVKLLSPDEVLKCVQNNAYVIFFQDSELSHTVDGTSDQDNKNESITC